MDNESSFPSPRKNKTDFRQNCHSKTKFKSNYITETNSLQPENQIHVSILESQHTHQDLELVTEPKINHFNRNSNISSCKKTIRKGEYSSKFEDDSSKLYHTNISEELSSSTYPLEEIKIYKGNKMEDYIQTKKEIINKQISSKSLNLQNIKEDNYLGEEQKLQNNAGGEKTLERCPVRNTPSPDPLAIATSQVFNQEYEAMPLDSPSNIYEARIYNYSKVKYSPLKRQEKSVIVSEAEKSQSQAISSSLDNHNFSTFNNRRAIFSEKYGKHSELTSHCNLNINYHSDSEPQALNLEVAKVDKLRSPKIKYSSPQAQECEYESCMDISNISYIKKENEYETRSNTSMSSLDEISKYYESGNLIRKVPLRDEKDLITNKTTAEKEGTNYKTNLRRSSRIPKTKRYTEEMFESKLDGNSPGAETQHIMKISNDGTGELWECNNCDAMFRKHNSLMHHHASCHLFTCYICNWKGFTKTNYEIHMSNQHFKQVDRCLACREEFSSYDVFRKHMINVHKTIIGSDWDSNATVNQLQQAYPKSSQYISIQNRLLPDNSKIPKGEEIYQTSHKNRSSDGIERTGTSTTLTGNKKCPYCPKSFMRQSRLVRHLNYHLGKKSFICNICKKSFVEKSGLDAHMVTHNPVNAACKHCDKVFKTERTLKRHLQTHKNKIFVCDLCNKVFRHVESLRVHKLTHNEGGSGNICVICNRDCKTPYYLQVHLKTKHESAKFECKDCQKSFKWKQSFTKHRQLCHYDPENDISTDFVTKNMTSKSTFECEICSQPHDCMSDLLKHHVSHRKEEKHACDICGKNFKHAYTRDKHIKMVHDDSNEHECPQCRAKFKAKEYLEQHIAHVHTTKDRVKCGQCGNDFKTEANLKSHIKMVHGHKKSKYVCQNCKKSFISPKDLSRHQKIHTQVRDFQCPVCNRGFSRKDNMTAHLRTHTEPAAGTPANIVSSVSFPISSESHISSTINDTSSVDTGSSKNVCEPITLTLPGNDVTVSSSQSLPVKLSQSYIESSTATSKQQNCSYLSSITSVSTMPHQVITTVSTGMQLGKDIPTSTATCILTVPNASLSSSPIIHTVPASTSITASFISSSNATSSMVSPSSEKHSSSESSLITLASSSLPSLTSPTVLPVSHLRKDSDYSMDVEVIPNLHLPQAVGHSVLQQDHVVVGDGILPLITPSQANFSEPQVVYTILEDGSSKLETLSIHPLNPGNTTGELHLVATNHEPMDS